MSLLSGHYVPVGPSSRSILRTFALAGLGCATPLLALVLLLHIAVNYIFWDLQDSFAIVRLDLGPDQPQIYARRELWGWVAHSGERFALTTEPSRCSPIDEEALYRLDSDSGDLSYRWDGSALHLYIGKQAVQVLPAPHGLPFAVLRHTQVPSYHKDAWVAEQQAVRLDFERNPRPCLSYWENMLPGLKSLKVALGLPTEL